MYLGELSGSHLFVLASRPSLVVYGSPNNLLGQTSCSKVLEVSYKQFGSICAE